MCTAVQFSPSETYYCVEQVTKSDFASCITGWRFVDLYLVPACCSCTITLKFMQNRNCVFMQCV